MNHRATNSATNRIYILREIQKMIMKHRVTSASRELDPIKVVRFIIKEFREAHEADPTYQKLRDDLRSLKARWNSKIVHETITFRRNMQSGWGNTRNSWGKNPQTNQRKRTRESIATTTVTTGQMEQPKAKRQTTRKKFCLCRRPLNLAAVLSRQPSDQPIDPAPAGPPTRREARPLGEGLPIREEGGMGRAEVDRQPKDGEET